MKHLLHTLEGRLATLPVPMAVQLPAGQQLGAPEPAVTLRFRDRMALVAWNGKKLEMLSTWSQSVPQLERGLKAALERPAFGLHRQTERQSNDRDFQSARRRNSFGGNLGSRLDPTQIFYAERLTDQVQNSVSAAAATLRSFAAPPGRKVMVMLAGGWPYSPAEYASTNVDRPVLEPGLPTGDVARMPCRP